MIMKYIELVSRRRITYGLVAEGQQIKISTESIDLFSVIFPVSVLPFLKQMFPVRILQ
jgi:hypothetical protein